MSLDQHREWKSQKGLPCGRCIGCRLQRAGEWALRCVHEASLWPANQFVTLTFDPAHLPPGGSVDPRHWQLFMKRLRKELGDGIRFYACGEYGTVCQSCGLPSAFTGAAEVCVCRVFVPGLGRPHYHGILFNCDLADKKLETVRHGENFYSSAVLEKAWGNGFTSVGDVTYESAGYVARYCMEKIVGDSADNEFGRRARAMVLERYQGRRKEFALMSRGGRRVGSHGIGAGWFAKFRDDVYPADFVLVDGVKRKPPRFYDNLLDKDSSALLERLKAERALKAERCTMMNFRGKDRLVPENSSYRLDVRRGCLESRIKNLVRGSFK